MFMLKFIAHQDCWFEVGLVRTVVTNILIGGLGGFWKFVMNSTFFDKAGHDFSTSGVHLEL